MELHGDRVVLRPLAEADVPRIVELGAHPEVARWWRGLTHEHVLQKARGEDDGVVVFAILDGDEIAGMIQHHEKVGFRRVGIMRRYWLDADGVWRDGLLLDLLAEELT